MTGYSGSSFRSYPNNKRQHKALSKDPLSVTQDPASVVGRSLDSNHNWIPLDDGQPKSYISVGKASIQAYSGMYG